LIIISCITIPEAIYLTITQDERIVAFHGCLLRMVLSFVLGKRVFFNLFFKKRDSPYFHDF
jgi:hypothetical protein